MGITLIILGGFSYTFFGPNSNEAPDKEFIFIADTKVYVDIADEPYEQIQGLSGREKLSDDEGMLFIFPAPILASFWMKDMKFSIDIIWIDDKGNIIGVEKNVSPDTFPNSFSPSSPVKYVLEVNANWSDENNIKIGDKLTNIP